MRASGRPLIVDVSRAISRAHHAAPTGIDRVDAAYRRWALAQTGRPVFALARMRRGAWLLDRAGLEALEALLSKCALPPKVDLAGLVAIGRPMAVRRVEALVGRRAVARASHDGAGAMAAAHASGARYLNTSHSAMAPRDLAPLAAAGLRVGALIHDTLPLDRPEFMRPETPALFEAKLRAAFAHADALIANSEVTAGRLRHWAGLWDAAAPEICVAPLGVEAPAANATETRTPSETTPAIFVALGTIEPRKNHLLLLDAWRRLFERLGPEHCPHLHIVGRQGWENAEILKAIQASPAAGIALHQRRALDEAELQALLARATALLAPSVDEGFGLPVAEALAAGVPVIASDIPAHREVGGEGPEYLDPHDGSGWEAAILDFAAPSSPRLAAARVRAIRYKPPSWEAHFALVEAFLANRDGLS